MPVKTRGRHWFISVTKPEDHLSSVMTDLYDKGLLKYSLIVTCDDAHHCYAQFINTVWPTKIKSFHSVLALAEFSKCTMLPLIARKTINQKGVNPIEIGHHSRITEGEEPDVRAAIMDDIADQGVAREKPEFILLMGEPGSGKTSWLRREGYRSSHTCYTKDPSTDVWREYADHETVVIDDFTGDIAYADMCRLTGTQLYRAQAGLPHRILVHPKKVLVSSNIPIRYWWPKRTTGVKEMLGNVTKVLYFEKPKSLWDDMPSPIEYKDWSAFRSAMNERANKILSFGRVTHTAKVHKQKKQ